MHEPVGEETVHHGIGTPRSQDILQVSLPENYREIAERSTSELRKQELYNKTIQMEKEWKAHTGTFYRSDLLPLIIKKRQDIIDAGTWSGGTGDIEKWYYNQYTAQQELLTAQYYELAQQNNKLENFVRPLSLDSAYAETPAKATKSSILFLPVVIIGVVIIAIVFLILRRRA